MPVTDTYFFAGSGCVEPGGCRCSCHDPVMGQYVKHFAACCTPEERQAPDKFERAIPAPMETR